MQVIKAHLIMYLGNKHCQQREWTFGAPAPWSSKFEGPKNQINFSKFLKKYHGVDNVVIYHCVFFFRTKYGIFWAQQKKTNYDFVLGKQ
jgi:hypothetical protein